MSDACDALQAVVHMLPFLVVAIGVIIMTARRLFS